MSLTTDALWNESTASPDIPAWVRVANARVDRTLFAPVTNTLDELKLTPFRTGAAMGMVKWSAMAIQSDVPPEVKRALKRIRISPRARRKAGKLFDVFLLKGGFVTKAELRQSRFIPTRAIRYEARLQHGPIEELAEYHRGMSLGLRGIGPDAPGDRSDLATEILCFLVMQWRLVVRLKSVTELHLWLTRMLGAQRVGEKKRVEKICERIGLTLREPGRPKEIPTLALPA